MDPLAQVTPTALLVTGTFAPVFWEPLGRRGERLVAGVLVSDANGVCRAYPTLQHRLLLEYLSEGKTDGAIGIVDFAFNHFSKTLEAGGTIEDLKTPFTRMSIGRVEAISARSEAELTNRAIHLCTLLGRLPEKTTDQAYSHPAARTRAFIQDVRQIIKAVNPELARTALKDKQLYPIGRSEIRLHFHINQHFAQFCSLPLPSARTEAATECQARLTDLLAIRKQDSSAQVELWMNTAAQSLAVGYVGKTNATNTIRQRTLDIAESLDITVREYATAQDAATVIQETANRSAAQTQLSIK